MNKLNEQIQLKLPDETVKCKSIDTVMDEDQVVNYPRRTSQLKNTRNATTRIDVEGWITGDAYSRLKPTELCNGTRLTIKIVASY